MKSKFFVIVLALVSQITTPAFGETRGDVLGEVRERGYLICGVGIGDTGFATQTREGLWEGFDVDYCRAIAVAVLGNVDAVKYVPLDSQNRFKALSTKAIDVLIRTTSWTYIRDTNMNLEFTAITLYDEQGILAQKTSKIDQLSDLDGQIVCASSGTTSIQNLADIQRVHGVEFEILKLASQEGRWRAFLNHECDAVTSDKSDLLAKNASLGKASESYNLVEGHIAKEPLGPVVREGDTLWVDIVRWVVFATIEAEERGISSTNISEKPFVIPFSENLKLSENWARNVISMVGNYGEIFERNIGMESPILMPRGANALWVNGGLIYAMPFR